MCVTWYMIAHHIQIACIQTSIFFEYLYNLCHTNSGLARYMQYTTTPLFYHFSVFYLLWNHRYS